MIEAIVSLVMLVVEVTVSIVSGIIEFIIGVVAVGGESLTVGELFILLVAIIAEYVLWVAYWIKELLISLFRWRKPNRIARPIIYKRSKRLKNDEGDK